MMTENEHPFHDDTTSVTGFPAVPPHDTRPPRHRAPEQPQHPRPPYQQRPGRPQHPGQPRQHRGTPPPYLHTPPPPRNGLGIAAVTIGVVALLTGIIPLLWLPAAAGAVTALALAATARGRVRRREADNPRTALAGLIIGALALLVSIIGAGIFFSTLNQLGEDLSGMSAASPGTVNPPAVGPALGAPAADDTADGYGSGLYIVGEDIEPGTYSTDGADGVMCYWERLSGLSGELGDVIANDLSEGPTTVSVSADDTAFATNGCLPWTAR